MFAYLNVTQKKAKNFSEKTEGTTDERRNSVTRLVKVPYGMRMRYTLIKYFLYVNPAVLTARDKEFVVSLVAMKTQSRC